MSERKMKLFVWEDVLTDYTDGMMFAVAHTVEEARAALLVACHYLPEADLAKTPQEFDMSSPIGFACWGGG